MIVKVDVYEDGDSLVVVADLPGVCCEDLMISIGSYSLTLRGRCRTGSRSIRNYHRQERKSAAFQREIPLPAEISPEGAVASIANGLLEVRLPIEKPEAPDLRFYVPIDGDPW